MNRQEQYQEYQMAACENGIRLLSAELVRLSKLPYRSWKNFDRIRSLDDQIRYLEEILAAFERDQKKL